MRLIDQAIEILERTNDGNDLSPPHLAMVEAAVNNGLTERGEVAFAELYTQVRTGQYKKLEQYLCGVKHLTRDHQGYVYWKGQCVEHFSYQDYESMRRTALRLAQNCELLEAKAFPVNMRTATSEEIYRAPKDTPWLEVLCRYYAFFVKGETVRVVLYQYTDARDVLALEKRDGVVQGEVFEDACTAYHTTIRQGYESAGCGLSYERIAELMQRSNLTPDEIHAALV